MLLSTTAIVEFHSPVATVQVDADAIAPTGLCFDDLAGCVSFHNNRVCRDTTAATWRYLTDGYLVAHGCEVIMVTAIRELPGYWITWIINRDIAAWAYIQMGLG